MKAREYTSPLIEKLLSEVTPEEMEKTEQLMEAMNNKQQTAVEWLLNAIETKNGEEFSSYYSEFIEQAKEMEKERMKGMYVEGSFAKMRYYDGLEYIDAEQYYNKTYREGEQ
jgi:hypothetical protein